MTQDFSPQPKRNTQTAKKIPKGDFTHQFNIESFGVKIGFSTNSAEALKAVKAAVKIYLPGCFTEIEETGTDHNFLFVWHKSERDTLYKNGEKIMDRERRETSVESVASHIRLTVAEFAVGRVFIHAGVIAWKGKAVVMPGRSFHGKTSLTVALVKRGAVYYSDEYAILDAEGFLHPFPKMLSVRGEINDYKQIDYPVEKFGGVAGTEKIRVRLVLVCEYKEKARWNPKILSPAKGIIEIIQHTIPIRHNPQFTLEVLNKVASDAVIVKSKRGDVSKSADLILQFIDAHL
ncbi:MAG TPA: hypothetical protein VNB22_00010 [Pyrinomonadaceae bacterium]|nr:hypothetical protein [Pyrinomonadaceae bacterium]